jgi:hypothetical protein
MESLTSQPEEFAPLCPKRGILRGRIHWGWASVPPSSLFLRIRGFGVKPI